MADDSFEPEWQNAQWVRKTDAIEDAGLEYADFDLIKSWVVKLIFFEGGNEKQGSGFFLNLPDLKDQHIILTAAHNLSDDNGTRKTRLSVVYYNNNEMTTCTVLPKDVYVGKDYKKKGSPPEDYGVVLIPKSSSSDYRGFGFSMKLANAEHFRGNVYVSGFQDTTEIADGNPIPTTSTGACSACFPTWMEYKVPTQPGFSGSPVWIEYKGKQMAVAIHNNGREVSHGGARGARLTPDFFREIYTWIGPTLLLKGVQLRAADIHKISDLPSGGLFLSFKQDFGFARVRFGSGTRFDVMPGQVLPKESRTFYAMTSDGKWVFFDTADNEVILSENVREACLFRKYRKDLKKKPFKVYVDVGEVTFQLRMQGNLISDEDEDLESSEVSFTISGADDKELYNRFLLE